MPRPRPLLPRKPTLLPEFAALGKVKPEIKAFVIDYTNKLVK